MNVLKHGFKFLIFLFFCSIHLLQAEDNFIAVKGGGDPSNPNKSFFLGLKQDGTVWAWGVGDRGQLGNGHNHSSDVPMQVSGLNKVQAISAGKEHALALKEDGTVWAWGSNTCGQLGNELSENSNVPIQILNLTDVKEIAAEENVSLAIKQDKSVLAWGLNDFDEMGGATTSMQPLRTSNVNGLGECTNASIIWLPNNHPGPRLYEAEISNGDTFEVKILNTTLGFPNLSFDIEPLSSNNVVYTGPTISNYQGNAEYLLQTQVFLVDTCFNPFSLCGELSFNITPKYECQGITLTGAPIRLSLKVYGFILAETPCEFRPPALRPFHFCGKVKKEECDEGHEIIHVLTWEPSADSTVDHYEITAVMVNVPDSVEPTTIIPASGPFKKIYQNRLKGQHYFYRLIAVNSSGEMSCPLDIVLPGSGKNPKKVCVGNCPVISK